jgi:hypothetical protein
MPHAIFFHYGFAAIQGTNDGSRLGGPALHGCVRLHRRMPRRCWHWSNAMAAPYADRDFQPGETPFLTV